MKYLKHFNQQKEGSKSKIEENLDEFPTEIRDEESVKDWLKWTQNNASDEKENKLVMNFLDHYHHTEKIKDEENQMRGSNS